MHVTIPTIFPVTAHTDHVGPGSTFVAIKGKREKGTSYIAHAVAKGASTVVVQEGDHLSDELMQLLQKKNVRLLKVGNTRQALATLSAEALNYPAKKLKIIGITGTKGKTTTSWLLEHLLRSAGYTTALLSTVRNRIGDHEFPTALTTQQPDYLHVFLQAAVEAGVTHVIMEVSAQALTLNRLEGIEFDGIIFTNFSQEHAEFYPNLDEYFEAKKQIFNQAKAEASLLINGDDEYGKQLQTLHGRSQSFGFANTDFYFKSYDTQNGLSGSICYRDQVINFKCPYIVGLFNLYNVVAAAGMAYKLGVPLQKIEEGLHDGRTAPGRMEMHKLSNGALCVIDYAHTPSSFLAILTALRELTDHLVIVFGCGGDRDRVKRPEMGRIAAELGDYIFITSDNPRSETVAGITSDIMAGINKINYEKIECEPDRAMALQKAYQKSGKRTVIALLGKGPDEYEEVDGIKNYFSEKEIILGLDAQGSIFTKAL